MRDAAKNVVAVHWSWIGNTKWVHRNDNCLPLSGLRQLSRVRALNEYTRTGCTGYFILFLHVYKLKKLEYVDISWYNDIYTCIFQVICVFGAWLQQRKHRYRPTPLRRWRSTLNLDPFEFTSHCWETQRRAHGDGKHSHRNAGILWDFLGLTFGPLGPLGHSVFHMPWAESLPLLWAPSVQVSLFTRVACSASEVNTSNFECLPCKATQSSV